MQPNEKPHNDLRIFKFRIILSGNPKLDLNMSGYLYDGNGTLVEGADIWRDELLLAVTESELLAGTLIIAPFPTDVLVGAQPSKRELMQRQAFRPELAIRPGCEEYALPDIPESVWKKWAVASSPAKERGQRLNLDFLFF